MNRLEFIFKGNEPEHHALSMGGSTSASISFEAKTLPVSKKVDWSCRGRISYQPCQAAFILLWNESLPPRFSRRKRIIFSFCGFSSFPTKRPSFITFIRFPIWSLIDKTSRFVVTTTETAFDFWPHFTHHSTIHCPDKDWPSRSSGPGNKTTEPQGTASRSLLFSE